MSVTYVFVGVAVADYDAGLGWYERLLGRPPDRFPNDHEAVWQLAETGSIYVIGDVKRAGHALLTLAVDDLDRELQAISRRGLTTGEVETVSGLHRKAVISDPDGNLITFFDMPGTAD